MTAPTARRHRARRRAGLLAVGLTVIAACSGNDSGGASTTTSPERALEGQLLVASDLPPGFEVAADVDDTITTFCAGQDITEGLRADARAVVGFTRDPKGASVIQLAFRYRGDDAVRFVEQAETMLATCHEVPDHTGLAFTYEPISPALDAILSDAEAHAARHGTSVGSGSLTLDIAALHRAEIAVLIAVLGVDLPREDLEALAQEAFQAAVAKLQKAG